MMQPTLTHEQFDRALGVVLAAAAGDALGAGYETRPGWSGLPIPKMIGGGLGNFAPGEWTDDTTMAWCILETAAWGHDLRSPEALTAVARHYKTWADGNPPDIGIQTSLVLYECGEEPTGEEMLAASRALHEANGRTAGNGSLMRTGVVALPYLHDEPALVEAVRLQAQLTHWDELNVEACTLWCCAIRHAVLEGELDVRVGLGHLPEDRRAAWEKLIMDAETQPPSAFEHGNGFVVTAFQAAWSAIVHTSVPQQRSSRHLEYALKNAVRVGMDTDTVAAIAGQLLGARWGASAVPKIWRSVLHGYPGITGEDLLGLARQVVSGPDREIPAASADGGQPHEVDDERWEAIRALQQLIANGEPLSRQGRDGWSHDDPRIQAGLEAALDLVGEDPDYQKHMKEARRRPIDWHRREHLATKFTWYVRGEHCCEGLQVAGIENGEIPALLDQLEVVTNGWGGGLGGQVPTPHAAGGAGK